MSGPFLKVEEHRFRTAWSRKSDRMPKGGKKNQGEGYVNDNDDNDEEVLPSVRLSMTPQQAALKKAHAKQDKANMRFSDFETMQELRELKQFGLGPLIAKAEAQKERLNDKLNSLAADVEVSKKEFQAINARASLSQGGDRAKSAKEKKDKPMKPNPPRKRAATANATARQPRSRHESTASIKPKTFGLSLNQLEKMKQDQVLFRRQICIPNLATGIRDDRMSINVATAPLSGSQSARGPRDGRPPVPPEDTVPKSARPAHRPARLEITSDETIGQGTGRGFNINGSSRTPIWSAKSDVSHLLDADDAPQRFALPFQLAMETGVPPGDHLQEEFPVPIIERDNMDVGDYIEEEKRWVKTVFPSRLPTGRMDPVLLDAWVEEKVATLREQLTVDNEPEVRAQVREVCTIAMNELIRQSSVHCVERGDALWKVWALAVENFDKFRPLKKDADVISELNQVNFDLRQAVQDAQTREKEHLQTIADMKMTIETLKSVALKDKTAYHKLEMEYDHVSKTLKDYKKTMEARVSEMELRQRDLEGEYMYKDQLAKLAIDYATKAAGFGDKYSVKLKDTMPLNCEVAELVETAVAQGGYSERELQREEYKRNERIVHNLGHFVNDSIGIRSGKIDAPEIGSTIFTLQQSNAVKGEQLKYYEEVTNITSELLSWVEQHQLRSGDEPIEVAVLLADRAGRMSLRTSAGMRLVLNGRDNKDGDAESDFGSEFSWSKFADEVPNPVAGMKPKLFATGNFILDSIATSRKIKEKHINVNRVTVDTGAQTRNVTISAGRNRQARLEAKTELLTEGVKMGFLSPDGEILDRKAYTDALIRLKIQGSPFDEDDDEGDNGNSSDSGGAVLEPSTSRRHLVTFQGGIGVDSDGDRSPNIPRAIAPTCSEPQFDKIGKWQRTESGDIYFVMTDEDMWMRDEDGNLTLAGTNTGDDNGTPGTWVFEPPKSMIFRTSDGAGAWSIDPNGKSSWEAYMNEMGLPLSPEGSRSKLSRTTSRSSLGSRKGSRKSKVKSARSFVPGIFARFIKSYRGKPNPRSYRWVIRVIIELYTAKTNSDRQARELDEVKTPLAQVTYDYFFQKYGLKDLAERNLMDLLFSLTIYKSKVDHLCAVMFSRFCRNQSEDALEMFLRTVAVLRENRLGLDKNPVIQHADSGLQIVTLDAARLNVGEMLPFLGETGHSVFISALEQAAFPPPEWYFRQQKTSRSKVPNVKMLDLDWYTDLVLETWKAGAYSPDAVWVQRCTTDLRLTRIALPVEAEPDSPSTPSRRRGAKGTPDGRRVASRGTVRSLASTKTMSANARRRGKTPSKLNRKSVTEALAGSMVSMNGDDRPQTTPERAGRHTTTPGSFAKRPETRGTPQSSRNRGLVSTPGRTSRSTNYIEDSPTTPMSDATTIGSAMPRRGRKSKRSPGSRVASRRSPNARRSAGDDHSLDDDDDAIATQDDMLSNFDIHRGSLRSDHSTPPTPRRDQHARVSVDVDERTSHEHVTDDDSIVSDDTEYDYLDALASRASGLPDPMVGVDESPQQTRAAREDLDTPFSMAVSPMSPQLSRTTSRATDPETSLLEVSGVVDIEQHVNLSSTDDVTALEQAGIDPTAEDSLVSAVTGWSQVNTARQDFDVEMDQAIKATANRRSKMNWQRGKLP